MMELTINSKTLGRVVTFSRPHRYYVFVDLNGQHGHMGNQICHGGHLCGSTIMYGGDDEAAFALICRRWYRAYLRDVARCGLVA